jgi:hypothetical protein
MASCAHLLLSAFFRCVLVWTSVPLLPLLPLMSGPPSGSSSAYLSCFRVLQDSPRDPSAYTSSSRAVLGVGGGGYAVFGEMGDVRFRFLFEPFLHVHSLSAALRCPLSSSFCGLCRWASCCFSNGCAFRSGNFFLFFFFLCAGRLRSCCSPGHSVLSTPLLVHLFLDFPVLLMSSRSNVITMLMLQ